ncbi:MAG: hypothetical protein AAGA77_04860 [Bacteroidota bacterium]
MNFNALRIMNTLGVVFMIGMNMLAVLLPLGGRTTGELSALYPNLFVPAGFTFAIWSIIYALLIIFVIYQSFGKNAKTNVESLGFWFIANMVANGLWLTFWHYEFVFVSFFVMLVLLGSLIKMHGILKVNYFSGSSAPWQLTVPISVYLGWISVATIANSTVVFIYLGYTDLGLGADTWAAILLSVAIALALTMLYRFKDLFFAAVVIWASFGIHSKRVADTLALDASIQHTSYIGMYILSIAIVLSIVWGIVRRKQTIS